MFAKVSSIVFKAKLLTDKETDRQTPATNNLLGGVKKNMHKIRKRAQCWLQMQKYTKIHS